MFGLDKQNYKINAKRRLLVKNNQRIRQLSRKKTIFAINTMAYSLWPMAATLHEGDCGSSPR